MKSKKPSQVESPTLGRGTDSGQPKMIWTKKRGYMSHDELIQHLTFAFIGLAIAAVVAVIGFAFLT